MRFLIVTSIILSLGLLVSSAPNQRDKRQVSQASASASASSSSGGGGNYGNYAGSYPSNYNYNNYQGRYNDYGPYYNDYYNQGQGFPFQFPPFPNFNFNQFANDINSRIGSGGGGYGQGASSFAGSSRIGGPGGGVSHTSTSNNVNGVVSSSGTYVDKDGRVTTFQGGSGRPNTIQTRVGGVTPGRAVGSYSASGVNVGPDGKVSTYRDSGHF